MVLEHLSLKRWVVCVRRCDYIGKANLKEVKTIELQNRNWTCYYIGSYAYLHTILSNIHFFFNF